MARTVFFISDGTGITAETLGRSLLSQFAEIEFNYITIPYINSLEKAEEIQKQIRQAYELTHQRPIVFSTLIDSSVSSFFRQDWMLLINFFETFINPLEVELNSKSSHTIGLSHSVKNYANYMGRINAINFSLSYDDGHNVKDYAKADVVLLGVSRSGKTPTCLYLALQYGIYAANYPITQEVMHYKSLPAFLCKNKQKLFGLTIDPLRLHKIRSERFPDSDYSTLSLCKDEVYYSEKLFKMESIPCLDTTSKSIEEIATKVMLITKVQRKIG